MRRTVDYCCPSDRAEYRWRTARSGLLLNAIVQARADTSAPDAALRSASGAQGRWERWQAVRLIDQRHGIQAGEILQVTCPESYNPPPAPSGCANHSASGWIVQQPDYTKIRNE